MLLGCYIISVAGMGIAVGSLAVAVKAPIALFFALGLGMMLGGMFRALRRIAARLEENKP